MQRIYKFPIGIRDAQPLSLPSGSTLLCAQKQGNKLCIWAMVDPDESVMVEHEVRIISTGHDIETDPGEYVGTVQANDGVLEWHIFVASVEEV